MAKYLSTVDKVFVEMPKMLKVISHVGLNFFFRIIYFPIYPTKFVNIQNT